MTPMQTDEVLRKATKRPWDWTIEDYSMACLHGPKREQDHVLTVHPCNACLDRADSEEWKWGRCTTPDDINAELIVRAVNSFEALLKLAKEVQNRRPR